jgi:RNA polymerase sigma-70 factor (ECF subfamily)
MYQNLWSQIQAGNQQAFQKLFEQQWQNLYQKALWRLGDETNAEDIVQEVFINL